jgi:hypothetical protein
LIHQNGKHQAGQCAVHVRRQHVLQHVHNFDAASVGREGRVRVALHVTKTLRQIIDVNVFLVPISPGLASLAEYVQPSAETLCVQWQ